LVFNHPQEGEGSLVIAATDSYRLGEVVTKLSSGPREEIRVIVPQRSLGEVLRIISVFKDTADAPATLTIQVSDSQVVFTYGTATLISRMIEGVYPDYRQIIPSQTKTQIMIEKKGLVNALKAASLFARSGLFDVYLKVDPTTGSVAFSGSDSSRGKNEVTVDAAILGEANTITLNYRFVIDGVNALDTDLVRIELIDAMNPCIILPGTDDIDRSYRYVVMPIRQ
jgi:DNA polymerase-3 subunit beta